MHLVQVRLGYVVTGYGNGDETGRDDANELFTYQIG